MKKVFLLVIILVTITALFFKLAQDDDKKNTNSNITSQTSPTPIALKKSSVFIPYWAIGSSPLSTTEDRELYFGVGVNTKGIDHDDPGYKFLSHFVNLSGPKKEKLLTIRMIDTDVNLTILRDPAVQDSIIKEAVTLAQENGFSGILLDFETSSLSFDAVVNRITNLTTRFSTIVHGENLKFAITIYGDTFYRARPYDISNLAKVSDEVVVMTYDFSKARGNPGPNFPFIGREIYGYDFKQMVSDFKNSVSVNKLTIALGMFGYDWIVDNDNKSLEQGTPLTLNQIKQKFYPCSYKNCKVVTDPQTQETHISYTDDDQKKHIVWYEGEESARIKQTYLEKEGIPSIAYWAYSYY